MDTNQTVRDIVLSDYRTADVLRNWGINFCCEDNLPLEEACVQHKLDVETVKKDLQKAVRTISISNKLKFEGWPIEFLVDYITYVHHAYIKESVPELRESLQLLVEQHGNERPYLHEVMEVFFDLSAELIDHLKDEEDIIFPYLKQISYTYNRKEVYGKLFVRTLRKPLAQTVDREHGRISALLLELRKATNHYTYPADVCANHQVIYQKFREFDNDLVQHKHLENNVLIPKAIQMEKELLHL